MMNPNSKLQVPLGSSPNLLLEEMTETDPIRSFLRSTCLMREIYSEEKLKDRSSWRYPYGIEQVFLEHGTSFQKVNEIPEEFQQLTRFSEPGHCFLNAFRGMREEEILYVEGYGLKLIPLSHAWMTPAKNPILALDPTWMSLRKSPPWSEETVQYFGISFDPSFVRSVGVKTGRAGVFATEDHDLILDILKEGFPSGAMSTSKGG